MAIGILGKKIGMTRIFNDDGKAVPVTVLELGPCQVLQVKKKDKDGYDAVQLGFGEQKEKRISKPLLGHFKKSNSSPKKFIREIRSSSDEEYNIGEFVTVERFEVGDLVEVTGTSKGKGFQGGMKRHGWKGGRGSHGSMFHRRPGSIGQGSSYPSRVFKGTNLPGRMGNKRVTLKAAEVLKVDTENNLLVLKGSIIGPNTGYVIVTKSKKGKVKVKDVKAQVAAKGGVKKK